MAHLRQSDPPRRPERPYPDRRELHVPRRRYDRQGYDSRLRPEEVGFFNPHLDTKDYDTGGTTYFRAVHFSINSFKDVARSSSRNLNKRLRGIAQDWYIGQLSSIEREYIREGHGVEALGRDALSSL